MAFGAHISELCGMAVVIFIGLLWNVFNFGVTVLQLWKAGSYQTVGLIISCISISNLLLELSTLALLALVWAGVFCFSEVPLFLKTVLFFWFGSSCVSFWSIAWLSVFYCVKIVSGSSAVIEKLKKSISPIVNGALVLTVSGSTLLVLPFFALRFNSSSANATYNGTQNVTCTTRKLDYPPWINTSLYVSVLIGFLCPFPLLLMLPTSLRLVVHLFRHALAMRRNRNDFQSTDSYLQVCKLTVSLVGVYLTTLALVSIFLITELSQNNLGVEVIVLSYTFYCTVTAVLLTASNKYLKEKLWALFCWRKSPDASDSVQTGHTRVA